MSRKEAEALTKHETNRAALLDIVTSHEIW